MAVGFRVIFPGAQMLQGRGKPKQPGRQALAELASAPRSERLRKVVQEGGTLPKMDAPTAPEFDMGEEDRSGICPQGTGFRPIAREGSCPEMRLTHAPLTQHGS